MSALQTVLRAFWERLQAVRIKELEAVSYIW